ncbi:uncharacterized protein LOC141793359 [Halichoeres trimaculatus]|uniref:uncharacterized protein LOC141793359 n=1 Tax=Halichoeres trimaculatus TaxID=147232 RepID=UPI003D9E9A2A
MTVLLLLCSLVSLGLSDDELNYGQSYSIKLFRRAQTLEYAMYSESSWRTIWNRVDPLAIEDSRYEVTDSYFKIKSVTQRDSGIYKQRDRSRTYVRTDILVVEPYMRHELRSPGEHMSIEFDLEPDSCNIYFISDAEYEYEIVLQGNLVSRFDDTCSGLEMSDQCGIRNDNLEMSCSGRFEIRDELNNKALVMILEMEYESDVSVLGVSMGIFFILFGCCGTIKYCCCNKSSTKKNDSESPDSTPALAPSPAANYLTYDREPAAPRREQPSETLHPALPSCNPSRPLIHNPPVSVPPVYSEVSAAADMEEDAPTLPVPTEDPGPRFELSFASELPLSSDSNLSHVYTSDKLNF